MRSLAAIVWPKALKVWAALRSGQTIMLTKTKEMATEPLEISPSKASQTAATTAIVREAKMKMSLEEKKKALEEAVVFADLAVSHQILLEQGDFLALGGEGLDDAHPA